MRKEFSNWVEEYAVKNEKVIFLTGDLGFNAFEKLQHLIGNRFVNVGVCEQNMINIASGLAHQGLLPMCYSIAPFVVFRAMDQIRINLCLHNMNVKLIGNGGGFGYGIMGPTHHAIEDLGVLNSLQNMKCYIPYCNEDVTNVADAMMKHIGPSYLRLTYLNHKNYRLQAYQSITRLQLGRDLTIVIMGGLIPLVDEALSALNISADVFHINELPLMELPKAVVDSLKKTQKLVIIEDHVSSSGVQNTFSRLILENNLHLKIKCIGLHGYFSHKTGSVDFHRNENKINISNLKEKIIELNYEQTK